MTTAEAVVFKRASAARSLVNALQASQDYARGRTSFHTLTTASVARSGLAFNLLQVLADAQLTRNELDALASSLDHLIASQPPLHEILQADAAHSASEYWIRRPKTDPSG